MSGVSEGTPFPDRRLLRLGTALGSVPGLCRGDPLGSAASWRADKDTALSWNCTSPSK